MRASVKCKGRTIRPCVFLSLLVSCGPDAAEFTRAKLMQAVQTNPQRVDVRTYVRSDWSRMCVFRGPLPADSVQNVLGFGWADAAASGIERSGPEILLVFTRDSRVLHSVRYDRRHGDFSARSPAFCLPRDRAVFRVTNPEVTAFRMLVPLGPAE